MALTFGQMVDQILMETNRTGNPIFSTEVQNAVVSAIKELETEELFLNQKFAQLYVAPYGFSVPLPEDFVSVLLLNLVTYNFSTIYTSASGFKETTFWELETYRNQYGNEYGVTGQGLPGYWALWENNIHLYPVANQDGHFLNLYYYYRDGYYFENYTEPGQGSYNQTSIWLGDFTQDVTRYTARGIFYRDSLQSPELAASDMQKAQDALARLKIRNSQRENLNNMSY